MDAERESTKCAEVQMICPKSEKCLGTESNCSIGRPHKHNEHCSGFTCEHLYEWIVCVEKK